MHTLHHFDAYAGQLVLNALLLIPGYILQSTSTSMQAYQTHCSYQGDVVTLAYQTHCNCDRSQIALS